MLKGSEKQIKWANSLLIEIEKQLQEIKDNREFIICLASKTQAEINDFMEDEELNEFLKEKINPRIIKEFDKLVNNLENKINNYTNASNVINDMRSKKINNLYKNCDYKYITNEGIEVYKRYKKDKYVLKESKKYCKFYWENYIF